METTTIEKSQFTARGTVPLGSAVYKAGEACTMTRLTGIVLCCAQLSFVSILGAQSATPGHKVRDVRFQNIAEPLELAGEPQPAPPPPTAVSLQFVQSKTISAANPHDVKTLAPAIRELTELIRLEPTNSDFYLLRATLSC